MSTLPGTGERGAGFPLLSGDLSWEQENAYRREANGPAVRHTYGAGPFDREKKGG